MEVLLTNICGMSNKVLLQSYHPLESVQLSHNQGTAVY